MSGFAVPFDGFGLVFWDPVAGGVFFAKERFGVGVVLFGGLLEPLDGLDGVLGGAFAAQTKEGELELGRGETLFSRFAVPAGGFGGVGG